MTTATKVHRKPRQKLQTKMLIDGQWRESASGKTFATINPATEDVIAEVAEGDADDVDRAVQARARRSTRAPGAAPTPATAAGSCTSWRI